MVARTRLPARRPAPIDDYDTLPGMSRAVVRVQEQMAAIEEKMDARAEHTDEAHRNLHNKMDQILEAVGQYGLRLSGVSETIVAVRGDVGIMRGDINTLGDRVLATENKIRGFEKKEDFVEGAAWAFKWSWQKIVMVGGGVVALAGIILGALLQYRPEIFIH